MHACARRRARAGAVSIRSRHDGRLTPSHFRRQRFSASRGETRGLATSFPSKRRPRRASEFLFTRCHSSRAAFGAMLLATNACFLFRFDLMPGQRARRGRGRWAHILCHAPPRYACPAYILMLTLGALHAMRARKGHLVVSVSTPAIGPRRRPIASP